MRRAIYAACLVLACAGCYDDTAQALKVIDGESSRLIYARILSESAITLSQPGRTATEFEIAQIEDAYQSSIHAYAEILRCEEEGPCRWSGIRPLCTDIAELLRLRRVLAPHSDTLALIESISNPGPLTMERVEVLARESRADGSLSELEQSVLLLATAAAAAQSVYAATPAGAAEAARRRQTMAIEDFQLRCQADGFDFAAAAAPSLQASPEQGPH